MQLVADAAVDLHLHTFASDGFWHPRTLMETVAAQGFRVVAICDHDSQKSVVEARDRAEDLGLIYVPGVEMTVTWNDRPWHLLVYGIAPDRNDAAAKPILDLVAYQERRNAEVAVDARRRVEASGRPLPSAQAEINGPNHLPVHVLRSMIRERHSARLKEAADLVVELGGAFTTHVQLTDVVAAAHEAGGITILAHPGRPDLGPALDEETLVRMLAAAPIDGLETNYRTYTDFVTESLRDMADRHGLLKSTGSDSHGPGQPVDPRPWQAAWCRDLMARLGIDVEPRETDWRPGMDLAVMEEPKPEEAKTAS